jgi:hypothetical protein
MTFKPTLIAGLLATMATAPAQAQQVTPTINPSAIGAINLAAAARPETKPLTTRQVERLVEAALPKWDAKVLAVPSRDNWTSRASIAGVFKALGETSVVPKDLPGGARQLNINDNVLARLEPDRGKVRYMSRERGWTMERFAGSRAIPEASAKELAVGALANLGLARDELGGIQVKTQMAGGASVGSTKLEDLHEMYRLVSVERRINNLPVHGSSSLLAINNKAQVARLKLNWPAFQMDKGLRLRDAKQVSRLAVEEIMRNQPLSGTSISAHLAYASNGDDEAPSYVPAVVFSVASLPTPYQVVVPVAENASR